MRAHLQSFPRAMKTHGSQWKASQTMRLGSDSVLKTEGLSLYLCLSQIHHMTTHETSKYVTAIK